MDLRSDSDDAEGKEGPISLSLLEITTWSKAFARNDDLEPLIHTRVRKQEHELFKDWDIAFVDLLF